MWSSQEPPKLNEFPLSRVKNARPVGSLSDNSCCISGKQQLAIATAIAIAIAASNILLGQLQVVKKQRLVFVERRDGTALEPKGKQRSGCEAKAR